MLPLEGMRVLDMTQIMAGPYCTMVLGDLGADVMKIERIPGGDDTRRMGPFVENESVSFMMINRNKKSLTLNLKTEKGKQIFYELAKKADVIVENYKPGVVKSLGIDYETIEAMNPGIIYCSVSGYGQTGPYSHKGGFDIMAQGMTGLMSMTGEPGGRPVKAGIAMNDISAGVTALYSILAAYVHKMKTGVGQYIDVSLVESGLAWSVWESAAYFGAGEVPTATGSRHRMNAPYQAYKTKDGYVLVGGANQRNWEKFCKGVVEKPEWIDDPRFLTTVERVKNVEELEQCIEEIFIHETTAYWVNKLDQAEVPGGPINTYDQTLNDPHILARGMVQEFEHPRAGKMKTLGIPAKLSKTPGQIRMAAPMLGQHAEKILSEDLGYTPEEIQQLRENGVI
ncbi:CaiB/BaiF CoA transferase family protein [Ammoniphilus resinae]|uniref:Formyl-CoA transferase n=1 Tax=Ammoniphilus resinae TaxID=861532 RepID=A0ABS4GUB9_9BACL|nr:CoA transferase [Ammoniphilus resinae]MBP1933871.1 formyl-CoA transferase [Ammoniphilus resinae]